MSSILNKFVGQQVIIRTYAAGVHYGKLEQVSDDGTQAILSDVRRVHYWEGAASLSQMACDGIKKLDSSRIAMLLPEEGFTGVIEVLPLSSTAWEQLKNAPVWKV